jgi:hypothetical protein
MRARGEERRAPAVFRLGLVLALLLAPAATATSIDTSPRPTLILPASGQFVAQDSWEGVALYRLRDASLVRSFRAGHRVDTFAVTRDEKTLLIACLNGSLAAFDLATGATNWSLSPWQSGLHGGYDASFAEDGQSLVVCDGDVQAVVFEVQTGRQIRGVRLPPAQTRILSAALSPDGSHAVLVDASERLFALDVATGRLLNTGVTGAWPARYSADGKFIALRSNNSDTNEQLRVVAADGTWTVRDLGEFSEIHHIKPLEDGGFLVSALPREDGQVSVGARCWPDRGRIEEVWRLRDRRRERMDFSPDGSVGVSTNWVLQTQLIDLRTRTVLASVDNLSNSSPGFLTRVLMLLGLRGTVGWIVLIVAVCVVVVAARSWLVRRRRARAAWLARQGDIGRHFDPDGTAKQAEVATGDDARVYPSPRGTVPGA